MPKPLLIVLHGSGKYTTDWATKHLARLDELSGQYQRFKNEPFSKQVEVVPLNYDTVFEGHVNRWAEQRSELEELSKQTEVRLPGFMTLLKDKTLPPADRGFLWSHVLDPVAYRGITTVRDEVRSVVLASVVKTIADHLRDSPGSDVSIMGHSLGTIVLHDILHLLASEQAGDDGASFRAGAFRFTNVFQVANATRLGPPKLIDQKPYDSHVRPLSAGASQSGHNPYVGTFYNFRNDWDPVSWWRRFNPSGWGDDYVDVKVEHVHQVNVHGFIHYLEHPDVHVEIFKGMLGFSTVSSTEHNARLTEFSDFKPNSCGDTIAKLMQELNRLRTVVTGGNLDEIAMGLYRFYKAVKTAREGCEDLFNTVDGYL